MKNEQVHPAISKHLATLQPISGRDVQPIQKDHVFLSYGSPSPELFPVMEYTQSTLEVLEIRGKVALQYAGGEGTKVIKDWIIERGKRRKIHIQPEEILITAGAAQAIDFTTRLLINPGDEVWVEKPTYFFALQSFQLAGANIQMFPMDLHGLDVDFLEKELAYRVQHKQKIPKLLYVMPNYHNPKGVTLSLNRRKKLAELAKRYDFYIIEDDAYTELGFEQKILPAIYAYAPERVLYLGTFSKIIAPGIRIGWVVAPELFIHKMKLLLLGPQISPITQEIVGSLLSDFSFEAHLNQLITSYRKNRDVMIAAIRKHFGNNVYFDIPAGGFFIWLQFQQSIDVEQMVKLAFANGVSVTHGSVFYKEPVEESSLRLCYSFCNAEQIERGVKLLKQAYVSLVSKQEVYK